MIPHPVPISLAIAAVVAASSSPARADCIDEAASRHGVNAAVLRAIGWHESRLFTAARSHNPDGSTDRGAFQINSVHLPELARLGLTPASLDDGCTSAEVAAWHYRRQVDRFGNTWAAVGAYHSRTPARAAWYADRIAAVLMSWAVLPRGALPSGRASAAPAPGDARVAPGAPIAAPRDARLPSTDLPPPEPR